MSFKITDLCIHCGLCEPECPNKAITEAEIYVIAPSKCTECVGAFPSSRCAAVCPVDACVTDPDRKEAKATLLERWQTLHPSI